MNFLLVIFLNVVFRLGENVPGYYQKKMVVGQTLRLESKLLLEYLTDVLPKALKQLAIVVNSLKTTSELRDIVHRLNKMKLIEGK